MSIGARDTPFEVAVIGAGVVGCAVALAAARRGARVVVLEASSSPGGAASGTNSGILHTGFDSVPGELETELILRSAELRDPLLDALRVPVLRCGALLRGPGAAEVPGNGVEVRVLSENEVEVPGEAVTDPVAYTAALAAAAERHGATFEWSARVARADSVPARVVVNCAGLYADDVARLFGDDSFEIYPRKGEFLVFAPPGGERLDSILLPVPDKETKGVLVFPTIDGHVIAGPTAIDGEDKDDWSVRPEAREEILPKAVAMWPPLESFEPVASYAGLRPAGRGVNYVVGRSPVSPRLVNVAAIRSTGLTASLGIAERVCAVLAGLGAAQGDEQPLSPGKPPRREREWWRRA